MNTTSQFLLLGKITSHKFLCKFYIQGSLKSACTIWIGGWTGGDSINYVTGANPDAGSSINESFSIEIDNGVLFLKALFAVVSGQRKSKLTTREAAEYLWAKAIERLN